MIVSKYKLFTVLKSCATKHTDNVNWINLKLLTDTAAFASLENANPSSETLEWTKEAHLAVDAWFLQSVCGRT